MTMVTVDTRGFSCPVPLLMVQEEVKKSCSDALEVLIVSSCVFVNFQRYAYHNGFKFEAVENGDEWTLKLTK